MADIAALIFKWRTDLTVEIYTLKHEFRYGRKNLRALTQLGKRVSITQRIFIPVLKPPPMTPF